VNLYLDDVRPAPAGWTLARTIAEAQAHLELGGVDLLSLDYDLGACDECIRTDPWCAGRLGCAHVENGLALVVWMVDTGHWPRERPLVHSANPSGREQMLAMIYREWDAR